MAQPNGRAPSPLPPVPLSGRLGSPPNTSRTDDVEVKSRFGAESAMGLLVENLKDRLLFAVPKKGRLNEKALELLAG